MAANIESLSFEISVYAADATREVNNLSRAVRRLSTALDGLKGTKVATAMRGVSAAARKASAEVDGLAKAAESMSTAASTAGMAKTQVQLTNAANEAYTLADAMQMVRNAMSSVKNDYTFATNMANSFKSIKMPVKQATDDVSNLAVQAMKAADAMQAIFGDMQNAPTMKWIDAQFWMGKSWGGSNPWESYWANGVASAQKAGLDAGRAYWESFKVSGGDMGGRIFGDYSYTTSAQQAWKGISGTFNAAIQQTQAFEQAQKALGTATKVLSPALEAAGVSVQGFSAAMEAAVPVLGWIILAIQLVVKAVTLLIDNFKEFNDLCKKFIDTVKDLKERYSPFEHMKKELASLLALAKRQVLRRAINAVIKAITEGFRTGIENLAEYDAEFGALITSLKNSLGLFKNSIGVAVAPILSVLIPALNQLLAVLTRAMNTLARLTALLTGKHTYTIAADFQTVEQSAGGANKAAKELQRTILGFDEINKLTRPSDSSGGGGGGSNDGISSYLTEEVGEWNYDSWGEAFLAFVQWLDKNGVPALQRALNNVSSVVNSFSTNLADMFSYEGVQDAVSNLATNIGEAINNFFNGDPEEGGLNWEEMGRAIGQTIRTAFNFAANLLRPIDFIGIGSNIATSLNTALEQFTPEDIENIAYTIFTFLTAGIQTAIGFLLTADFPKMAEVAGNIINSLVEKFRKLIGGGTGEKHGKWTSNFEAIANNIASGITSFLNTVDWETLFSTANEFVDGLFKGLNSILDQLLANKQFVAAIRRFVDLVLKIGLKWFAIKVRAIVGVLASYFNPETALSDPLDMSNVTSGWDYLTGSVNSSTDAFENAADAVDEYGNAVSKVDSTAQTFNGTISASGKEISTFGTNITDAAAVVGQSSKDISDDIGGIGTAAKGANSTVYSQMLGTNGVTARLSKLATDSSKPVSDFGTTIGGLGTAAKNAATEVKKQTIGNTGSVVAFMKTMKTDASDHVEKLKKNIGDKLGDAATSASNSATSIKNSVVGAVSNCKTELAPYKFNDVGGNIKDGIINGMGDFNGKLDQWASQFKNRILQNFKIKSPSRWARDMVGVNIGEGIAIGLDQSAMSIERTCAGLKEGIAGEFNGMGILGGVASSAGRAQGGVDFASAIGDQLASAMLSAQGSDERMVAVDVYLDSDVIATAVTKGQQKQNRRYSTTD